MSINGYKQSNFSILFLFLFVYKNTEISYNVTYVSIVAGDVLK